MFFSWVSVIRFCSSEPWLLTVGALRVQCVPSGGDRVDKLAVSRGLLTCCPPHILLTSHTDSTEVNQVKVKQIKAHYNSVALAVVTQSIICFFSGVFIAARSVSSHLCFVSAEAGLSLLGFWRWVMYRLFYYLHKYHLFTNSRETNSLLPFCTFRLMFQMSMAS